MNKTKVEFDQLSEEEKDDLLANLGRTTNRREYYNQWAKYYLGLRQEPPEAPLYSMN